MNNYKELVTAQRDELQNVCLECGGRLNLIWAGSLGFDNYALVCVNNKDHVGIKRPYDASNIDKRLKMTTQSGLVIRGSALPEQKVREIIDNLWSKAPDQDKVKAVMICMQYGLNPLAKHLYLIPFDVTDKKTGEKSTKWEIIYAIKAKRLIAYNSRVDTSFGYDDKSPRLMTPDEEKSIFGSVDDNFWSAITILVDDHGRKYYGYGRWLKNSSAYGSEKGNSGQHMAQIRSESDALERYAPSGLTSAAVIESDFYEVNSQQAAEDIKTLFGDETIAMTTAHNDNPYVSKLVQIKEGIDSLKWEYADVRNYLKKTFKVKGETPSQCLGVMTSNDIELFLQEIERRKKEKIQQPA